MSTVPVPTPHVERRERSLPAWLAATPLWAGLSIIAIWIAVLFVGVFGGDIVSNSASSAATVPTVVVVAFFAFLATVPIARWGFRSKGD